jgi:hypothetical protein
MCWKGGNAGRVLRKDCDYLIEFSREEEIHKPEESKKNP